MGLKVFESGKEFEDEVKNLLEINGLDYKEQPLLTPFGLRFDFLVSNKQGQLFAIEVSKRNSIEDVQKLCFRSIVCKEFHKKIKTIVAIPAPSGSLSKLKTMALLLKFYDMFLFEEYLAQLPELFGENSKKAFIKSIKNTLASVNPEFLRIVDALQENNLMRIKELSKICVLPKSRIDQLTNRNVFSLSAMGLVESVGNTYIINDKLRIK